jgi:hypothetical protein
MFNSPGVLRGISFIFEFGVGRGVLGDLAISPYCSCLSVRYVYGIIRLFDGITAFGITVVF